VYKIEGSWVNTDFYVLLFELFMCPDVISQWIRQKNSHHILCKSQKKYNGDLGNDRPVNSMYYCDVFRQLHENSPQTFVTKKLAVASRQHRLTLPFSPGNFLPKTA
jgi:hypothetical protein